MTIDLIINMATDIIIARTAANCTRELVRQGWQGPGEQYDLGNFHGDREALRNVLGRAPTREESDSFEQAVRDALDENVVDPAKPREALDWNPDGTRRLDEILAKVSS